MLDKRYVNLSLMMKHFRLYLDGHQLHDPVQNESFAFHCMQEQLRFEWSYIESSRYSIWLIISSYSIDFKSLSYIQVTIELVPYKSFQNTWTDCTWTAEFIRFDVSLNKQFYRVDIYPCPVEIKVETINVLFILWKCVFIVSEYEIRNWSKFNSTVINNFQQNIKLLSIFKNII